MQGWSKGSGPLRPEAVEFATRFATPTAGKSGARGHRPHTLYPT
jgi:hypothetical protein